MHVPNAITSDRSALIDQLLDVLGAHEHASWSSWQEYLHSKCGPDPTHSGQGALLIMPEDVERWQRQIETPYNQLTEAEQLSDQEQVARYLPSLTTWLDAWILAYGDARPEVLTAIVQLQTDLRIAHDRIMQRLADRDVLQQA